MPDEILNPKALEPLYQPWEEPNKHRLKGKGDGAVHKEQRRQISKRGQ